MNQYEEYNMYELRKKLKNIELSFLGLKTPVGRFVNGNNGIVTREKIQELTDKVINHEASVCGRYVGMSGIRRRYYELLFYLIFRTYDPNDTVYDFYDFLEVAREICCKYKSYEELFLTDAGRIKKIDVLGNSFFDKIKNSCHLLSGKSLTTDLSGEELDRMESVYKQKKEEYEQKKKEIEHIYDMDKKERKAIIDKYSEYELVGEDDYMTPEEEFYNNYQLYIPNDSDSQPEEPGIYSRKLGRYLMDEEKEKWLKKESELREKWIESFENPDEYLDAYKEFSELLFCLDIFEGNHNLEDSILGMLQSEKFNKIGDDERLLSLLYMLDKAKNVARRSL